MNSIEVSLAIIAGFLLGIVIQLEFIIRELRRWKS